MSSIAVPAGAASIVGLVEGEPIVQADVGELGPELLIEGDTWRGVDDHPETEVLYQVQAARGDGWVDVGRGPFRLSRFERFSHEEYLDMEVEAGMLVGRPSRDVDFDTDTFRLLMHDGLHVTVVEFPAIVTPKVVTTDVSGLRGLEGDLCDVIWSAKFERDGVSVWYQNSHVDLSYEDIADGFESICTGNVITEVADDANTGDAFELHLDSAARLHLSGVEGAPFFDSLAMTEAVTWADRIALPELEPDRHAARAAGLVAVEAILALDRPALARLTTEQIGVLADGDIVSRQEFLDWDPIEAGSRNSNAPGRAELSDGRFGRIEDYLANYDIEIENVDLDRWPWLADLAQGRQMYFFDGLRVRADGQKFLWAGLLGFVLVKTDDGWKVMAV